MSDIVSHRIIKSVDEEYEYPLNIWEERIYQQGRADVIREVFAKIGQPNECLFNYQSACCYPIDDCMNCPITIDGMKQLKEQNND